MAASAAVHPEGEVRSPEADGFSVSGFRHPCRNVPLRMENAPDINVLGQLKIENQPGKSLESDSS
jgi:hypothetical protein